MTDPRRILYIHHSNDLYGADIVLRETVKGLDKSRYTPVVVLPEDCRRQGGLAAELDALGVAYHFFPLGVLRRRYFTSANLLGYLFELARATRHLCRIIRAEKIEIVHSNTLAVCAGAFAAKVTATPHVWHIHEMLIKPRIVRRLLHFIACHLSCSIVCISHAVKQHLMQDQPRFTEKMSVVYNGLRLEDFISTKGGGEVRREFGIPTDSLLVGMVGRVNEWKGQLILAQAASIVLKTFPDVYFISVGSVFADEWHHMNALTAKCKSLHLESRFFLSDFRRDIPEILAALDVYVHPSILPEPFGLVVLEAMAAGKPIVASAHGGPLEMIEDGANGRLVKPGSALELANGIMFFLDNEKRRNTSGQLARNGAFQRFHIDRYLQDIQAIYNILR